MSGGQPSFHTPDSDLEEALETAASLIARADALLVTTGAGMGVDSGLPDFRGNEGLWRAYPALARSGLGLTSIASPESFRTEPRLAWGFYGHRLSLYRRVVPHAGFALLRRWGTATAGGSFVFTSNVDGHFQAAGFPADSVLEVHGSIHYLQCTRPCSPRTWPADKLEPDVDEAQCLWRGALPACPHCGALARPNILMFGDSEWIAERTETQEEALRHWFARAGRPVIVEIGAGTHVPSVRRFGERIAVSTGAALIRINPKESQRPHGYGVSLHTTGLDALLRIDRLIAAG